jgi:cytochrome c oxidase subunit 3
MGSIGLSLLLAGFALKLNGSPIGGMTMIIGVLVVAAMMFLWFGQVIGESESGSYNQQVDHSFRWAMGWFIFSEVMFFAAFFGALFYARVYSVPWLGGEGAGGVSTNPVLWPNFEAVWPTNGPGDVGGEFKIMPAGGVPALNTIILLSSGVTVTFAHWAILRNRRPQFVLWLLATVGLGFLFVGYGSTFFMLTGFHGAHVTIGAIMLGVMTLRAMKGHFSAENHFGFEAAAWYWHFVDVVWLGLFIFVYWL